MARQFVSLAVAVVSLAVAVVVVLGGGPIALVTLVIVGAIVGALLTEHGHGRGGQHG